MTPLEFALSRLDKVETKLDAIEADQVELSAVVREATAMVRAGIWIIGVLWAVTIAGLGLWLALRGH